MCVKRRMDICTDQGKALPSPSKKKTQKPLSLSKKGKRKSPFPSQRDGMKEKKKRRGGREAWMDMDMFLSFSSYSTCLLHPSIFIHFTISTSTAIIPTASCIFCASILQPPVPNPTYHSSTPPTPSTARSLSIEGVMKKKQQDKQILARSPQSRYPSPPFSIFHFQASISFHFIQLVKCQPTT